MIFCAVSAVPSRRMSSEPGWEITMGAEWAGGVYAFATPKKLNMKDMEAAVAALAGCARGGFAARD